MEAEKEMMHSTHEDKKRKMKTPLQLETLERVFAEEKYPSEAIRARLSVQLGLSNRQLKMWFCHRRLKERKSKGEDEEPGSSDKSSQQLKEAPSYKHSAAFPSPPQKADFLFKKEEQLSGGSYESQEDFAYKFRRRSEVFAEKDVESPKKKRSRHTISNGADSWRVAELQAIASVEAQLGEPLRWDSPCLGVEFDSLPPGAFTSPAVPFPHWKPSHLQESRSRLEIRSNSKPDFWLQREPSPVEKLSRSRKGVGTDNGQSRSGSRSLQEYQFIPERPTGRDGMTSTYERGANGKVFLGPENSRQGLMLQVPPVRGSESLTNAFGFEGKAVNAAGGLLLQRDMYNTLVFPQPQLLTQESFPHFGFDVHLGGYSNLYHILPPGGSLHGFQKLPIYDEQEAIGANKKRKSEEIRKRVQTEVDREELARRKREEQLQKEKEKELEKLLREKQREDERLMRDRQREDERLQRERQREDERLQREARRETERQERFMQKEAQRLEREREKEEARRLKEATRMKAAIERATARRLARECVELIDDERLELLEAAATSQGLPSIYLLDGETLQGLDRYKDSLKKFPPCAVKMKKPLAISPWIESQQNLGSLFMVWRFLIAFADILGLWPFTLDEFVQAFHDYESRLLAEIHVALFKTIVKDVEDMAKASASAGAVNQYTAASTIGGGHTQLVEAAFALGFDYRDWSRYLNASTWPEILRQFSLAAGFGGPIWKQQHNGRNGDDGRQIYCKGNAGMNNLRSGTAGTSAATLLKGKGGSQARKCGYRLTPGTVKFAAFHVLSVEGPRGLPIVEIVSRIEKYGLRDLTTSKTPESSVAAALSRDTTFFERVAPSTYCVKPAYRKNPEDSERLLQAALEKIRLFQSGVLDAYDDAKDTDRSDELEKEQISGDESDDMAEDDAHGDFDKGKLTFSSKEVKVGVIGDRKAEDSAGKTKTPGLHGKNAGNTESRGKHALLSSLVLAGSVPDERERRVGKTVISTIDNEIDESHGGEPWVQGLLEGEYANLSVEERLDALVALVEVVNEGNTVRVALEERLEASTALKRQMWAEAQLDKRRTKEEQLSKPQPQIGSEGIKSEGPSMSPGIRDGNSSTPPSMDYMQTAGKKSPIIEKEPDCSNQDTSITGVSSEKSRAQLKVDIDFRADELYVFRSLPLGLDRRHNRYWQLVTSHAAEDPGCGRVYFESSEDGHWEVIDTEEAFNALLANLDTRGVREAHLHGVLVKLENLIRQGMRRFSSTVRPDQRLPANESEVKAVDSSKFRSSGNGVLTFHSGHMEEDGSSGDGTVLSDKESCRHAGAIQIQIGNSHRERKCVLDRYREFDKWFWSRETPEFSVLVAARLKKKRSPEILAKCEVCHDLFWNEEKHCSYCHTTFEASAKRDVKYMQHVSECEMNWSERNANEKLQWLFRKLPSRVRLLKAQFLLVEAAIPAEALKSSWTETKRKAWASSLKHASSPSSLLQLLSELESAIHQDWLSRRFESSKELMESASIDTVAQSAVLPWVPRTTAAVAMRLVEFDSALYYSAEQKQSSNRRRKPNLGPGVVPSQKAQIADAEDIFSSVEEGWKEAGIKQHDTGTDKHLRSKGVTKSDYSTEHQEALKVRLQVSKKHSDTSVLKDRQSIDLGDNAVGLDKAALKSVRGSHSERGKQSLSPNFNCGKHSQDLKTEMAEDEHELHRYKWAGSLDAIAARSAEGHYKDDGANSGTEEDEYDEEAEGAFENGSQRKEWVAVSEDGETDSMEEENEDEDDAREPDHRNEQEQDLMNSDDDSEDRSSKSESSDESE